MSHEEESVPIAEKFSPIDFQFSVKSGSAVLLQNDNKSKMTIK